jgi:hypothetical protein
MNAARALRFASLVTAMMLATQRAEPGPVPPGKPGDYHELKVLQVFSARDGDFYYRAFLVEWQGQEVVALDHGSLMTEVRTDHIINVLVVKGGSRGDGAYGWMRFMARPEKHPPALNSQLRETPVDMVGANPTMVVELRVDRVYFATDGDYQYRAYQCNWQGNDIIVPDQLNAAPHEEGDILFVRVTKQPPLLERSLNGVLTFELTRLKRK